MEAKQMKSLLGKFPKESRYIETLVLCIILSAIILTPICPHSFNQKPLVLPDDKKIEITVASDYETMNMTVDGQQNVRVRDGDVIKVRKGGYVDFFRLPSEHYFMNLRNKLGWGERVEKGY